MKVSISVTPESRVLSSTKLTSHELQNEFLIRAKTRAPSPILSPQPSDFFKKRNMMQDRSNRKSTWNIPVTKRRSNRNSSFRNPIKWQIVREQRQNLLNEKLFLVIFGYPCVHRLHCIPINHPASSSLPSSISLSLLPPFLSPFTISRQRKQGKIWINMVSSKAVSSRRPQGIILYHPSP